MFVIYEKETTHLLRILRKGMWENATYQTAAAAKRAFNKLAEKGLGHLYAIADVRDFRKVERTEIRRSIMPGPDGQYHEFEVPVNTPWTSGPWSETYWSN